MMRRICLILVAASLAVPAVAAAAGRASGDGSLALSDASGTVWVTGRGVIYGHLQGGTLMIFDYRPDDPTSVPAVSTPRIAPATSFARPRGSRGGTSGVPSSDVTGVYSGTDIRFLLPAGRYTIELIASAIDVSGVGRGTVVATGLGTADDGTLSVNGGKAVPLTRGSLTLPFGGKVQ